MNIINANPELLREMAKEQKVNDRKYAQVGKQTLSFARTARQAYDYLVSSIGASPEVAINMLVQPDLDITKSASGIKWLLRIAAEAEERSSGYDRLTYREIGERFSDMFMD